MSPTMKCLRCACVAQLLLAATCQAAPQPQAAEVLPQGKIHAVDVHPHPRHPQEEASLAQKKQLMRSDETNSVRAIPGIPAVDAEMAGGVRSGSCKNFKKTGAREVSVSCPHPLKMVGCSCRDKFPEKDGGCGTKFGLQETCSAVTGVVNGVSMNVTAYARCCHMDWAGNLSITTSDPSLGEDGKGAVAKCRDNHTLLGCACEPVDAPNRGCKHTRVMPDDSCMATNLANHSAGVRAQALCGDLPNSTEWESPSSEEHLENTNLGCTDHASALPQKEMLSCSCGSDIGKCNGGKVIANKCQCIGPRCYATARCAIIPTPPRPCIWADWTAWDACSVSCGTGKKFRMREIGWLANGGEECTGPLNETTTCKGEANSHECGYKKKTYVATKASTWFGWISTILIIMCVTGGTGACVREQRKRQEAEAWGGGDCGEYGGAEATQEYPWGGEETEAWGEENVRKKASLDGNWTVRWLNGNTERITVRSGSWTFPPGTTYTLNEDGCSFTWPSDGTVQTLQTNTTAASQGTLTWSTTNADYPTIFWDPSSGK